MLDELRKLNAQMGSLPGGIGAVLGPMLTNLIAQALAAGMDARYTANTIASLGPEAVAAGGKPFKDAYGKTINEAATSTQQAKIALDEIKGLGLNEVDTIKFVAEKAKSVGLSADRVGELLGLTPEQLKKNLAIAGIPAFAKGGHHKGGLALVGEEGPELVDLGPSTIYTARHTREMLRGATSTSGQPASAGASVTSIAHWLVQQHAAEHSSAGKEGKETLSTHAFELLQGNQVPAFAEGGAHQGGLAMVGEEGPELVRMGPSHVFTATETQNILGRDTRARGEGGGLPETMLRELILEIRQVKEMIQRLIAAELAGGSTAAHQRETQIKALDDIGRKLQPAVGGSRKYVGAA